MKRASKTQSTTSLDMAPEDDESLRVRNYLLTMGVRTACIILCAAVVPYGWHTGIFAVGAIALPYIAVVLANAASGRRVQTVQHPDAPSLEAPVAPEAPKPAVLRIHETPPAAPKEDA